VVTGPSVTQKFLFPQFPSKPSMDDFESESTVYKQAINNLTTIKLKMELVLSAGFKVKSL
jgi:hypothetical protein